MKTNGERAKITVRGAVQGIGFRPFVFKLATELRLTGWVLNSSQGVQIEVEGARPLVESFLHRLEKEKPPHAVIHGVECSRLDAVGYADFEIRHSSDGGGKTACIPPDLATCADCLSEIFDPGNRRYLYPFTNCTNCGPRFSIIEALPYDRRHTSMKQFAMCPDCEAEYHDPRDRRFHAQPNACPKCGPQFALWDETGKPLAEGNDAQKHAVATIRAGGIVALKGLGGFQLLVDARNENAVLRLRERKRREEKPFALMYSSLSALRRDCEVSPAEERLLLSSAAPIVLLERAHLANATGRPQGLVPSPHDAGVGRGDPHIVEHFKATPLPSPLPVRASRGEGEDRRSAAVARYDELERLTHDEPAGEDEWTIAPSVAPGNPALGAMLPSTPLHHILLREFGFPIVATSGNLANEPICTDENEALQRLQGIADYFLVHNRPIVRHMDDSIARVMLGRELVLRRARGYAPLPIRVPFLSTLNQQPSTILAVGAHLKSAVALNVGNDVFVSQHIGDLETKEACHAFGKVTADLPQLYEVEPDRVARDLHPDYFSSRFAQHNASPAISVQHHYAHVLACMAENELAAPVLGVAWDGTGFGTDGTIWGGEFLLVDETGFERVGHLRTFRLPGGDTAIRQPRRSALGMLHEIFGDELFKKAELVQNFTATELHVLRQMLAKEINVPVTSSAGRLFDAVASLAGLRQRAGHEGQAAMELECASQKNVNEAYPFELRKGDAWIVDWEPMILKILEDARGGENVGVIAARFHNTLAEVVVAVSREIGIAKVALSGGCFQNRYLTERAVRRLHEEGFRPYWHQRIPPNDGGIALGQVMAALRAREADRPGEWSRVDPHLEPKEA